MSLPVFDPQGSLFGSLPSVAAGLFAEDDRYKLFAQKVWPVMARSRVHLERCYTGDNGRRGIEPVVMLGVLIFQFLERVPDRQAVEMVKYHLGWKLALNMELGDGSFHSTSLVYFRQRLIDHEQAQLAFSAVLEALQEVGLVPRKGKQRLDSTHVLGLVARLSRLECVRETMRLALEELSSAVEEASRPDFWEQFWERYVENKLDFKSPESVLKEKLKQAGEDMQRLLCWLEPTAPEIREGRQARLLKEVFSQQYIIVEGKPLEPVKTHAPGAVQNPHDPEAQWSAKGEAKAKKEWVGYKVQVAENVGPEPQLKGEPERNFITSILTQSAIESDAAGLAATVEAQGRMGLEMPRELYVDSAYVSAAELAKAKEEERELVGPARPSPKKGKIFRSDDFEVCVEERRAICPAGKENTQCSRLEEKQSGNVSYRFEWSTHCHGCPLREQCVAGGQNHRTLVVGEHHSLLQARRIEQKTEAFEKRMHVRNGIEGTQSELVRAHGLRRARYRGKAKLDLQNQFIGAACNIKRWLRLLAWQITHSTSTDGLTMATGPT